MKQVVLSLTLILTGCAALGTKSNLTALVQPNTMHNIAFTITKQTSTTPSLNRLADSILVKELTSQLSVLPDTKITFLGDVEEVMKRPDFQQQVAIYDALFHAELTLSYNGALAHDNGYNSWVRMQGFKLPEKQLLGDSYFNTQSGKAYTSKPNLGQSVHDGVEGVLRPWLQRLKLSK